MGHRTTVVVCQSHYPFKIVTTQKTRFNHAHAKADTVYRDGKLNFWQDIASLTSTDPSAAREFMSLCVKSCDDKSDIKASDFLFMF